MQPPEKDPRSILLSTAEVAERLHVQPRTIVKRLREGEMPFVRIGQHYFVAESDVIAWIDARKQGGKS